MERRETMWAEMKPDVYSGVSCEEHRSNWYSYAAGDKDGGDDGDLLQLSAQCFPPGTKVTVTEPVCPNCDTVPCRSVEKVQVKSEHGDEWMEWNWSCECDFDWRNFANNEYS